MLSLDLQRSGVFFGPAETANRAGNISSMVLTIKIEKTLPFRAIVSRMKKKKNRRNRILRLNARRN